MKYTKETFIEAIKELNAWYGNIEFCESCSSYNNIIDSAKSHFKLWALEHGFSDFADRCDWRKLEEWELINVIKKLPQFADRFNWGILDGSTQCRIIIEHPQLSIYCDWGKFNSNDWFRLLLTHPQFADKCDLWLKWCGGIVTDLLIKHPQYVERVDLRKLNGRNWSELLCKQPQFSEYCDWSKLDGTNWYYLLKVQPQFEKYKKRIMLEKNDFHDVYYFTVSDLKSGETSTLSFDEIISLYSETIPNLRLDLSKIPLEGEKRFEVNGEVKLIVNRLIKIDQLPFLISTLEELKRQSDRFLNVVSKFYTVECLPEEYKKQIGKLIGKRS